MLRRFRLAENGTTLRREVVAGATTFATMAYIIAVQPAVLSQAGMDFGAVMVATCVASAIASILMGLMANYPIALAPAMGHNFYFVFGVCAALGVPWQIALGANCIAGIGFVLLSLVGVRERIISAIPPSLQHAISAGIGLLIAFVGLQWAGIVVRSPATLVALGDLTRAPVLLSLGGIALLFALHTRGIPGAVLITLAATTIAGIAAGVIPFRGIAAMPPSLAPTFLRLDLAGALRPGLAEVVFVFFFLALFDTAGTLVGVCARAGLLRNGILPRARQALLADSLGIVQGTMWGTSTITSYVESAAGVAEGGRTGLTSIVTAALFLASLFFSPLAQTIGSPIEIEGTLFYPIVAPPLVLIGAFMLAGAANVAWSNPAEALPAFLCMVMMPFTFSIADGIGCGMIAYCVLRAVVGRTRDLDPILIVAALLFVARFALR